MKTKIIPSIMFGVKRRIKLSGLKSADIRFFHEPGSLKNLKILQNSAHPYLVGDFLKFKEMNDEFGKHVFVKNVSGDVLFSW